MTVVKKRAESPYRWAILFLTCVMMIGNYYCYDIPASLNSQMDDYFGKPSDFETLFSLLYTVYSVPNIVLPFFGGYFVDSWGVRICLLIFACLITAGQVVFALGLSIKSWPVMLIGRVIYGFGGENLGVANSAILSIWFEGKELAFAFGLNLSVARLGSVINNLVSPALANSAGIQFALWFGVILCGSSVAAVLLISGVDKHVENGIEGGLGKHALLSTEDPDEDRPRSSKDEVSKPTEEKEVSLRDLWTFRHVFWILAIICVVVYGCVLPFNNIASALLLERDYFMTPPAECHLTDPNSCQSDTNIPVNCPSSKWYQPPLPSNYTTDDVDCTETYWKDDCTKTYCDRFSDAQVQAGTIMSIPYIISACLSPLLGGAVDRFGLRAVVATIAPFVLIIVHYFLGYSGTSPVGPLIGQGLAYSGFAAVLWPSVALVVDQHLVGLGYGIVVSVQNFGLAVFPLIIATIYADHNDQYIPSVEMFFISLAIAGTLVGVYLNYIDYFFLDNTLNTPGKRLTGQGDAAVAMKNPLHEDEKVSNSYDPQRNSRGSATSGGGRSSGGRGSGFMEEDDLRAHSTEIYATSMIH